MLIDARTLRPNETITSAVCVVGGGPAGLTVARELGAAGVDVAVLESGGFERDPAAQDLCVEEPVPGSFQTVAGSRRRQLGGNANVWDVQTGDGVGLRHRRLDAIDFERRDWLPYSGWPLDLPELAPHYRRAEELFGLPPDAWEFDSWSDGSPPFPLTGAIRTEAFRVSATSVLTDTLRGDVERAPSVDVWLHATVLELEVEDDRVVRARVRTPSGDRAVVADEWVLAAGALDTARLLLLSAAGRGGLGNERDFVGRFFMDHPFVRLGVLAGGGPGVVASAGVYDLRRTSAGPAIGALMVAEEVRRSRELLSGAALLFPRAKRPAPEVLDWLQALGTRDDAPPKTPVELARTGLKLARRPLDVAAAVWARARYRHVYLTNFHRGGWSAATIPRRLDRLEVVLQSEQAPEPANRVRLGRERDAVGQPRLCLDTTWGELDRASVAATAELLAHELAAAGLGRLASRRARGGLDLRGSSMHHHLGTTRMASDPSAGVVDRDGKVFGVANLHVAGGSVFSTGGSANPTLSIVALALRLGGHLLRSGRAPGRAARSTGG